MFKISGGSHGWRGAGIVWPDVVIEPAAEVPLVRWAAAVFDPWAALPRGQFQIWLIGMVAGFPAPPR